MESLSATVDARDAYTAGHSRRVQQLALAIGRELGPLARRARPARPRRALPRHRQARDSGLDPAEAGEPDRGGVGADAAARRRGRPHHRPARLPRRRRARRSATTTSASTAPGYPDRLRGEEIPLGARIIHVADALDSMLTTRIYRAARPLDEALDGASRRRRLPVLPALRLGPRADPRRSTRSTRRQRAAARRSSAIAVLGADRLRRTPGAGPTGPSPSDMAVLACLQNGENALALLAWDEPAATLRWQASIRRRWPRSRPGSASATRTRRSSRS